MNENGATQRNVPAGQRQATGEKKKAGKDQTKSARLIFKTDPVLSGISPDKERSVLTLCVTLGDDAHGYDL